MAFFRRLFGMGVALLVMVAAPAYAATQTVTNLNDSGGGSLRSALANAAAGDTVVFAPGLTGTIPLATVLTIAQSVTIQGPGAGGLTISGPAADRVINITGGDVTVSGVTIANGHS